MVASGPAHTSIGGMQRHWVQAVHGALQGVVTEGTPSNAGQAWALTQFVKLNEDACAEPLVVFLGDFFHRRCGVVIKHGGKN